MYNKYYSSKELNYLYFNSNRWTKDKVNFNSCLRFLGKWTKSTLSIEQVSFAKDKINFFFYLI